MNKKEKEKAAHEFAQQALRLRHMYVVLAGIAFVAGVFLSVYVGSGAQVEGGTLKAAAFELSLESGGAFVLCGLLAAWFGHLGSRLEVKVEMGGQPIAAFTIRRIKFAPAQPEPGSED